MRKLIVLIKLVLCKFLDLESFCKECGRKVHDFSVDDKIWNKIEPHIKYGNVLCYDCFCEKCKKLMLPQVWKLKKWK